MWFGCSPRFWIGCLLSFHLQLLGRELVGVPSQFAGNRRKIIYNIFSRSHWLSLSPSDSLILSLHLSFLLSFSLACVVYTCSCSRYSFVAFGISVWLCMVESGAHQYMRTEHVDTHSTASIPCYLSDWLKLDDGGGGGAATVAATTSWRDFSIYAHIHASMWSLLITRQVKTRAHMPDLMKTPTQRTLTRTPDTTPYANANDSVFSILWHYSVEMRSHNSGVWVWKIRNEQERADMCARNGYSWMRAKEGLCEGKASWRYAENENKDLTYTHAAPKISLGISSECFLYRFVCGIRSECEAHTRARTHIARSAERCRYVQNEIMAHYREYVVG